jgi:hypothetical protein
VFPTEAHSLHAVLCESREIATISSLKVYGESDAITVSPDLLPPEVISGLSGDSAVPFIIVRWITHCYAEVRCAAGSSSKRMMNHCLDDGISIIPEIQE